MYVGAVKEMMCVVCESVTDKRGHSGDGCDLASTLCKYDLREGDVLETIDVCIWCIFVLVTVWGSV